MLDDHLDEDESCSQVEAISCKWHIVSFEETDAINIVPENWVAQNGAGYSCRWPPVGDKYVTKKIKKSMAPDDAWKTFSIIILKTFDSYDQAKIEEKRLEQESNTENDEGHDELGRGKRKIRKKTDTNFVDCLPPMPQFEDLNRDTRIDIIENIVVSDEATFGKDHKEPVMSSSSSSSTLCQTSYTPSTESISSVESIRSDDYNSLLKHLVDVKEDLRGLRKLIENKVVHTPLQDITQGSEYIPIKPYNKLKNLLQFDETLNSDSAKSQLKRFFELMGGDTARELIRRGLCRIMTNKIARKCSWTGKGQNFKIGHLRIFEVLKDAVRSKFFVTDKSFEDDIKLWLRQAELRYSRQMKKNELEPSQ